MASKCTIKAFLLDILGVIPAIDTDNPPKIFVSSDEPFFHGASFVLPFTKLASFNTFGEASIDIIETETPQKKLQFFVTFPEEFSSRIIRMNPAIVPNQVECPLNELTETIAFDLS